MPFDFKIKTFDLPEDLVGRTLTIRKYSDDRSYIIVAIDIASGELFVLKEVIYPERSKK